MVLILLTNSSDFKEKITGQTDDTGRTDNVGIIVLIKKLILENSWNAFK